MKHRIAVWAIVGVLIAAFWGIFSLGIRMNPPEPILWNLARFSCLIVFVGLYFHFGVRLYWVLAANAATYAVLGVIVETLREHTIPFDRLPNRLIS